MRLKTLAALLLTLCGTGLAAQQTASSPAAPVPTLADARDHVFKNEIMPALALLDQIVSADPSARGQAAQYWAFSGDLATADALFAPTMQSAPAPEAAPSQAQPAPPPIDLSQVQSEPALEAIVRGARGKRIVMINEAHHSPQHRAFIHRLLLALRQEGFTHYAAETFCNGCDPLVSDGAPVVATGFYTRDPVFGDLVRQAVAAGYRLVAYEARPDQMAPAEASWEERVSARDKAQAENLKAALDADPSMRVIVHVGFGHIREADGQPVMVAKGIGRLTGEDPLTIDQVDGTRLAGADFDTPLYRAYLAAFGEPAAPMVIRNDPHRPLGNYRTDLSVIHPLRHEVAGRPDWLAMDGYRKPHEVAVAPLGERMLVSAFLASEPAEAIAMDQMLVQPGAVAVTLMLPTGDYRLVRLTEAGEDLPLGNIGIQ